MTPSLQYSILDIHEPRDVIFHLARLYELFDHVDMDEAILRCIAYEVGRLLAAEIRRDRLAPELAHLNDAAVGMAQVLARAIDNRALPHLRRGVLAVDRRHVVELPRAAHQRRR